MAPARGADHRDGHRVPGSMEDLRRFGPSGGASRTSEGRGAIANRTESARTGEDWSAFSLGPAESGGILQTYPEPGYVQSGPSPDPDPRPGVLVSHPPSFGPAQFDAIQFDAIQFDAIRFDIVQFDAVRFDVIQGDLQT